MGRAEQSQFNVRFAFARDRARELARQTGMTATEVVEDALRGYVPPETPAKVGRLVRCGPILVAPTGGKRVTLDEANAALEAVREGDD
jgi:hypothetical protein